MCAGKKCGAFGISKAPHRFLSYLPKALLGKPLSRDVLAQAHSMRTDVESLVLQAVDRGGHAASAVGEDGAGVSVYGHDGGVSQKAAELQSVADLLADGGDDAHGGCLVVDHADGALVGDDAEDRFHRRVAGDGDHIEANAADAGHGLELLEGKGACLSCADHAGVFRHGNERA